jgi:hypothetical protein
LAHRAVALLAKPSGLEAEAAEKEHGVDLSARRSVLAHTDDRRSYWNLVG